MVVVVVVSSLGAALLLHVLPDLVNGGLHCQHALLLPSNGEFVFVEREGR